MKLWIDDVRPAPKGYVWCKSTNDALRKITVDFKNNINLIDLDHDAGDFAKDGGDFINVLNELERLANRTKTEKRGWAEICKNITFKLHSMNPVGIENMRRIIERNGWKEIR